LQGLKPLMLKEYGQLKKDLKPSYILNDELDVLYGVIQGACYLLSESEDKCGQDIICGLETQFRRIRELIQNDCEKQFQARTEK